MAKTRARVFVTGRVQGVFFRAETRSRAVQLRLKGWVRNIHDGRVEALFEGEETDVDQMISWCRKGPPHARVESVEVIRKAHAGEFDSFIISF